MRSCLIYAILYNLRRGDIKKFIVILIVKYTCIMVIKSINQIIDIQTLFCKTKDVFDVKKSNKNEHLFNMKSTQTQIQ